MDNLCEAELICFDRYHGMIGSAILGDDLIEMGLRNRFYLNNIRTPASTIAGMVNLSISAFLNRIGRGASLEVALTPSYGKRYTQYLFDAGLKK